MLRIDQITTPRDTGIITHGASHCGNLPTHVPINNPANAAACQAEFRNRIP
jgi:hypothetical protein